MALEIIPVSENTGQSQSSAFELTSTATTIHTAASGTGFSELVYVWYAGFRTTRITFSVKNSSGVIMQSDSVYLDKEVPFVLNPDQSLELSVDGEQTIYVLARAERSTLSGASLPVDIDINGTDYSTASAGSSVDIPVEYENGTPVGSLVSGVWTIPDPAACDPASITVNGDSPALEVASGASQDIAVHDSAGADVGSRSGATVTIADGTVTVNGAGSIAAKAEATTNVNVENSAGTDVGSLSGSTVTIGDMTLDYPDGTTEALVLVPGNTVTIDPELLLSLAGTETSVSFTTPAWDTSFTVSAQTITGGGSISNIVIDGGSPVASFVSQSIPASVVVTFDITGTVTQVKLEF